MNLWLDDTRPAPTGWTWVHSFYLAQALLRTDQVVKASLDHDLGACDDCLAHYGLPPEILMECEHIPSGYDLVCWMERTGHWPKERPTVHSQNPAGRARMLQVINSHY